MDQDKENRYGFDYALNSVKQPGVKVTRDGWNGKGLFIRGQFPHDDSEMGNPYICIDATALGGTTNPWVPSQTDLFAEDWHRVE